jgi:ABC-2 type transport system permease protein
VTAYILGLSLRQLVGRKSTLLLLGLNALPLLIAFVFRLSDPDIDQEEWVAGTLMLGLIVTTVLPLTALMFGTSVLGDEIEDGTAVYLLTKPLARWQILLPKLAAAWLVTVAFVLPATLISGYIALPAGGETSIVIGFAAGVVLGTLAYVSVFVLLSVVTSRALIAGLIYVFVWEGAVTSIFAGTRYLSIRHFTLGISGAVADVDPSIFDPYVNGTTALILLAIVTLTGAWYANLRLKRLEVREPS